MIAGGCPSLLVETIAANGEFGPLDGRRTELAPITVSGVISGVRPIGVGLQIYSLFDVLSSLPLSHHVAEGDQLKE